MQKPILSYDAPMGGGGRWTHAGGYSIWSLTTDAAAPLELWEKAGDAPAPLPQRAYILHNIAAGVPHRLARIFGFWRSSDGDAIFLKTTDGPRVNYTLALTPTAPHYRYDRIAWYCAACRSVLKQATFETKRFGLDAFWNWTLDEVRAFNADVAERTCASCGVLHPAAYGISSADDTPEEKGARTLW